MSFIDLSLNIYDGGPAYPGDPECRVIPYYTVAKDGCNVSAVSFSSHNATHLDAPRHFLEATDAASISDIPLERLCGRARVVDCSFVPADEPITAAILEKYFNDAFYPGTIVLIQTGWDKMYGTDAYYCGFPYIGSDAARWIADRGISMLGLDLPTPNRYDSTLVHRTLLGSDVLICEGLANLCKLPREKDFEFFAFPLKFTGLDGSPVRAVARVE